MSSATALSLLVAARADGVRITAETCPHYLALAAEDVPPAATQFKCCPPIRDRANRERLWDGLRAGMIDCVVSDHSPCPPELKLLADGDFGAAWGGISSVQLALPVVWTYGRERGCTLADLARWMAAAPAKITGLTAKGAIAVGRDADLVAFAPDAEFTVSPACCATGTSSRRTSASGWLAWSGVPGYAARKCSAVPAAAIGAPRGELL